MKTQNTTKDRKPDGSMDDREWFNVCWNYFVLMSNQRIQMVNFFISIEIVLIGAFFTLLNLESRMSWAEYAVSAAIMLISLTFFGLDRRTRAMIHRCESVMEAMENIYMENNGVECPIHAVNTSVFSGLARVSYSKWFLFQFSAIGGFGVVCFILLLAKLI